MSRRHRAGKRTILPDAKYHNHVVAKFINCMMYSGKKSTAERNFYKALELLRIKLKEDELKAFLSVVESVKPFVEVRSRRVGGATYQVPVEVRSERQEALAIRWLINAARGRSEKTMFERLAGELADAFAKKGSAYKKREDTHRMADANKAFAHFRW